MRLKNIIYYLIFFSFISVHLFAQEVTIEWDDESDNEDGFCIEYQINAVGPWIPLDSVDASITQYGPFSFTSVETYFFRVYAYNASGNSGYSNTLPIVFGSPAPIVSVTRYQQNQLQIEWPEVDNATGYNIYRDTEPFFMPDYVNGSNRIANNINDINPGIEGVQWIDNDDVLGDPDNNYFYVTTALNGDIESNYSNRIGEFDYSLLTTQSTNFNEIALPLITQGISNAQELMSAIPGCNSVARWNANIQSYEQYIPTIPPTNFTVEAGYPYYVNVTENSNFTLLGEIANPFFNLIVTSTTNFNEIMLNLNKAHIMKASDLMADIPYCNSVAHWNVMTQSYDQYIPGIPPTDFDMRVGYPYYVNVTQNVTWPEGGTPPQSPDIFTAKTDHGEGSNAPHMVWGRMRFEVDADTDEEFHFKAFIDIRPEEILTEMSPGCMIKDGYWIVQCATFQSSWEAGERLKIVFQGKDGKNIEEREIELTYNPADEVDEIILSGEVNHPDGYWLHQNYPNPFNPSTMIPFQVPDEGHVKISILNMLGQEIQILVNERKNEGYHEVVWNGRDKANNIVGSGKYLLHMVAGVYRQTRKILFVR